LGGGAWPFLVGGVICLVNSVNERDLEWVDERWVAAVRRDLAAVFGPRMTSSYSDDRSDPVEVQGNNRSVMPFDVRGRTRATLLCAGSFIVWCALLSVHAATLPGRAGKSLESTT
jgi:hypothetical protein